MKKFLLGSIAAMLLACFATSFQSCNEDTLQKILSVLSDSTYSSILDQFLNRKDSANQGNIWNTILGKGDDSETKGEYIAGFIEQILSQATKDTNEYVLGTWAYSSTDGSEIDTIWFYQDSTMLEHYISTEDTLDIQYSGGYIYYASYEQMIVQINSVYNYFTKKSFDYDEYHIYGVKKPVWMSIIGNTTLVMTDLDTETGETISEVSYNYVGDVDDK